MKSKTAGEKLPIKLNREAPGSNLVPFTEHFQGFEKVGAVRSVFGDRTEEVLRDLKIGFIPNRAMYMGIRDNDGNLAIGTYHLRKSPTRILYLDIVHELFHINQRMTNEKWFHEEFMKFMEDRALYYASPIEIQAYEHTVREAERIGMSREEITQYLRMGDAPAKTWKNFLREMKMKDGAATAKRVTRFPVKIKRGTTPKLYPFTDYFQGFEKVDAVRELFGERTKDVLDGMKVEFIDSPWPAIYPNEDGNRLVVANDYLRNGATASLYIDAFLGLAMMKGERGGARAAFGDDLLKDPTSMKAYSAMVSEARRLGLSDAEILEHLVWPSFLMSKAGFKRFLRALGLRSG